jgi:hypothetical protein
MVKFNTLTPLSLLISCELPFPVVSLKISTLSTFTLKSSNKIFVSYPRNWWNTCYSSSWKLPFTSPLLSSDGACTSRTFISHQWPLNIVYNILLLINCTLLTAGVILWCTKYLSLTDDPHSFFHRKMYNPRPVGCHPSPIWPPVHQLSRTYASITPFQPSSMNLFCRAS